MRIMFSWLLFAVLVVLFLIAAPLNALLRIGGDFRSFVIPLGVVGALLSVVAVMTKAGRWLKLFFILTGSSALGWPTSLYLHDILIKVFPNEPLTYILVFFVLPVTFIAGIAGTIIVGIRGRICHSRTM
jgi:hypothetical protein